MYFDRERNILFRTNPDALTYRRTVDEPSLTKRQWIWRAVHPAWLSLIPGTIVCFGFGLLIIAMVLGRPKPDTFFIVAATTIWAAGVAAYASGIIRIVIRIIRASRQFDNSSNLRQVPDTYWNLNEWGASLGFILAELWPGIESSARWVQFGDYLEKSIDAISNILDLLPELGKHEFAYRYFRYNLTGVEGSNRQQLETNIRIAGKALTASIRTYFKTMEYDIER